MSQASDLVDQMTTALVLVNGDGYIQKLNAAAEQLISLSNSTANGVALGERLPCIAEELNKMIKSAAERGLTYAQDLTINGNSMHSEDRIVDCRVSPFQTNNDALVLLEFSDITRRLRVHREHTLLLQHVASRKMVRQLAHEIKNPLGGIRGAAQLLSRKIDNKDLSTYTEVIVTEVDRLAGLADTLLGPAQHSEKTSVNIHDLLEHVARLTEAREDTSVRLKRQYDPSLPSLQLDENQIIQAILNLTNNAVLAAGPGGSLVFRTNAMANFTIGSICHRMVVGIDIEDDGPGIPEDIRDSIFFPLVTGTREGTGLGLPLAQELLNRHGGFIEFSTRPGRTIFSLRLPVE